MLFDGEKSLPLTPIFPAKEVSLVQKFDQFYSFIMKLVPLAFDWFDGLISIGGLNLFPWFGHCPAIARY